MTLIYSVFVLAWADAVSEADSETSSLLSCTDFSDISKVKDKPKKKYLRKTLIAPSEYRLHCQGPVDIHNIKGMALG